MSVLCSHDVEAAERVVKKDGPNKNRKFFCCAAPADERCGFFKWAEKKESTKRLRGDDEVEEEMERFYSVARGSKPKKSVKISQTNSFDRAKIYHQLAQAFSSLADLENSQHDEHEVLNE